MKTFRIKFDQKLSMNLSSAYNTFVLNKKKTQKIFERSKRKNNKGLISYKKKPKEQNKQSKTTHKKGPIVSVPNKSIKKLNRCWESQPYSTNYERK